MLEFQRPVVLQLAAGELLQWRERRPVWLSVVQGRVWVTRAGDLDDHFLDAGQTIHLAPGARAIVEAEGRAQVSLVERPSLLARLVGRAALRVRPGPTMPAWTSLPTS
ncbi:DUF2917 domain-containing protein [Caldimonas sp. KR1-144]|uniref:DUF2917 domain-containing protein n=1 Tax=Caldimonas sp. KR1-144 TaxID=3400911 RepID=UPI003C05D487